MRARWIDGKWYADDYLCSKMYADYASLRRKAFDPVTGVLCVPGGPRLSVKPRKMTAKEEYEFSCWVNNWLTACLRYQRRLETIPEAVVQAYARELYGPGVLQDMENARRPEGTALHLGYRMAAGNRTGK